MTENLKDCPYGEAFFNYTIQITTSSAREVVACMRRNVPLESVLDVGCAQGVWLKAWRDSGGMDCAGIDSDHVPRDGLLIDAKDFTPADLSRGVSLGRTFDLVQSLEVAEHLPPDAAETFVANLVRHGRFILFSAAPPGQGGLNHVNEMPYEYWRDLFAKHDFALFDAIRPLLRGNQRVAPWYRYNMFLYVHRADLDELPEKMRAGLIFPGGPIPDISPPLFRLRKRVLRSLPYGLGQHLARLKHLAKTR